MSSAAERLSGEEAVGLETDKPNDLSPAEEPSERTMIFSPLIPSQARPELTEHLTKMLGKLSHGGLRLAFDSPEKIHARQTAWPKDAQLSETQLRAELQAIAESAKALAERANRLCEKLPDASDAELEDEIPQGLYYVLLDALLLTAEDGFDECVNYLERALAATPESLRDDWLNRQLERGLKPLGAAAAEQLLPQLMRASSRVEAEASGSR